MQLINRKKKSGSYKQILPRYYGYTVINELIRLWFFSEEQGTIDDTTTQKKAEEIKNDTGDNVTVIDQVLQAEILFTNRDQFIQFVKHNVALYNTIVPDEEKLLPLKNLEGRSNDS